MIRQRVFPGRGISDPLVNNFLDLSGDQLNQKSSRLPVRGAQLAKFSGDGPSTQKLQLYSLSGKNGV
jgi:hypothetical protein